MAKSITISRVAADLQVSKARSMAKSKGFTITRSADGMPRFTPRCGHIRKGCGMGVYVLHVGYSPGSRRGCAN
jgi:hypothetical protein